MAMSFLSLFFLLSPLSLFPYPASAIGEDFGFGIGRDIVMHEALAGTPLPAKDADHAPGYIPAPPAPSQAKPPRDDRPNAQPFIDQSGVYASILKKPAPAPSPAFPPGPDSNMGPAPSPDPASLTPIQQACRATNFTELCEASLKESNKVPAEPTATDIIQASIWIANQDLKKAQSMIQAILRGPQNVNLTNAAQNCVEYFQNGEYRIKQTVYALQRGRIKDARTYLSAAHTYEYDVWSALKYVNNSQLVNQTMAFTWSLIQLSSNALSMVKAHDVFGDDMALWGPPQSERNGLWEGESDNMTGFKFDYKVDFGSDPAPEDDGSGKNITGFGEMKPDVTVCKGGTCDFEMIQNAVDAGPTNGNRHVIAIKAGVYDETVRVPLQKKNVVFMGDGMGKTIITGAKNVQTPGVSTYNSATVGVKGDGFMACNLTIQNTAGNLPQQAVAFMSDSDQTVLENCELLGNQDTLYAHTHRQFYKSCRIVGNVDFIFGNSAAIFQDCVILIAPRTVTPEKGETNCVTAHGRIDPAQSEGFVFHNCVINATQDFMPFYLSNPVVHKNYLGRPWKEHSRTVFINCLLGPVIHPEGWSPWSGTQGLATLYYGEFNSTGPGGSVVGRVPWSNQIPPDHVKTYSVENFIQGDEWIPKSSLLSPPLVQ
ncbi:probable pectinesterase/pectinesterase inhibitor 51 [Daucus carota subsp. sativus]|nr:PREDICTED: probable pectinesterase/pectinesterase inhibitor 51 [Daucus carota subsp. sativus]